MSFEEDLADAKACILEGLGHLCAPIEAHFENSADHKSVPYIQAQFAKDYIKFFAMLAPFNDFTKQLNLVKEVVRKLGDQTLESLSNEGASKVVSRQFYEQIKRAARKAILGLPCRPLNHVFPAKSPFEFYTWLRSVCCAAVGRLVIVDRFLTADIFHRYLAAVPPGTDVVLVTDQRAVQGNGDWMDFVDIAKLYGVSRHLEVRDHVALHDRYVVAGNDAYQIGNSIKDAARQTGCTVNPVDPGVVEAEVSRGTILAL